MCELLVSRRVYRFKFNKILQEWINVPERDLAFEKVWDYQNWIGKSEKKWRISTRLQHFGRHPHFSQSVEAYVLRTMGILGWQPVSTPSYPVLTSYPSFFGNNHVSNVQMGLYICNNCMIQNSITKTIFIIIWLYNIQVKQASVKLCKTGKGQVLIYKLQCLAIAPDRGQDHFAVPAELWCHVPGGRMWRAQQVLFWKRTLPRGLP